MANLSEDTGAASAAEEVHTHRWRIGAQAGAFSNGVCACGAEKEFPNGWDREPATGRAWAGSGRASK